MIDHDNGSDSEGGAGSFHDTGEDAHTPDTTMMEKFDVEDGADGD